MTNTPEVVVTISANDIDTGVGAYLCLRSADDADGRHAGMGGRDAGVEVRRDDSVYSVSGRRPEDDLRLVQGCRRERLDPGQRHDSGQYLGLPLRVRMGPVGPRRVARCTAASSWRRSTACASDQQGALFVVDNGNNRVQKFDNAGNFIILWGNFGSANANFHNPTGIACDGKGDVWVVDTNNHRVQKFDGKLGGYLMKFGSRGNGEGPVQLPMGYCRRSRARVRLRRRQRQLPGAEIRHDRRIHHVVGQLRQRRRPVLFPARHRRRSDLTGLSMSSTWAITGCRSSIPARTCCPSY